MEPRTIFFIGKPGCGKGTQAKLLAEKTGWTVVSAGKQFRAIAAENTPVGRKVKSEIDVGMLAPHWFAMYLYLKALFALPGSASVIFDGFNRKVREADLVIDSLSWLDRHCVVFNISVSDNMIEQRLAHRKEVEGRTDDSAVLERLKEYREFTEPAIEVFRAAGVLIEMDGERPPEDIAADIRVALSL